MAYEKSSILEFYNQAQIHEFARKFMFKVNQIGPLTDTSDLIYITTATLPGRTVVNKQVKFMGLNFNIPGTVVYDGSDSWQVTFRCDEAHNIRRKILAWQDEIFSIQRSGMLFGTPRNQVAEFQLMTKSRAQKYSSYTFYGIYPTKVGEIEYDITDDGEVQTFQVTFAYQFWVDDAAAVPYNSDNDVSMQ